MKYLLILILPFLLSSTFTPFSGNPPANSITAKGNLLTSDGSAQGNHSACPNGEFLIWDSTDSDGVKCTGSSLYQSSSDALYFGDFAVLNYNTSNSRSTGMNFYPSGTTAIGGSIYQDTASKIRIRNNASGEIAFVQGAIQAAYFDDVNLGAFILQRTGGNVPHNCRRISAATSSTSDYLVSALCDTNEIPTGGGCQMAAGSPDQWRSIYELSNGFLCVLKSNLTAGNTITAIVTCCDY